MGQAASDILTGSVCELCSEFFATKVEGKNVHGHEHGHPAVCRTCWRDLPKRERYRHKQAAVATISELQEVQPGGSAADAGRES